MEFSCKLGAAEKLRSACLVVGVFKNNHLTPSGKALDEALSGQLKRILKRQDFAGDVGQTQMLYEPRDCSAARILLVECLEHLLFGHFVRCARRAAA